MEITGWIAMVLSLIGAALNVKMIRLGFLVWILSNVLWIWIDIVKEIPQQAIVFVVYTAISIWGWISWGRKDA